MKVKKAVVAKKAKPEKRRFGPAAELKGAVQISFKIPKEWLVAADRLAKSSTIATSRAAVLRAAVKAGLASLRSAAGGGVARASR